MGLNLNDLKDAEEFQKHFVSPLVEAVRAEVRPLVESDKRQQEEIDRLKQNQGKVLVVFTALTFACSTAIGLGIDWVKSRFFGH